MKKTFTILFLIILALFTTPVKAASTTSSTTPMQTVSTPQTLPTTTVTDHGFGYGENTFTKNFTETTRTIIIIYDFTPWTSNTLITHVYPTGGRTGSYTTTPITTVTVGGTGTLETSFINSSTVTIIETSWGGIHTIISQTGWLKNYQTTTITLIVFNSYSFHYLTTATIIEYLTTIVNETPVYTTKTYPELITNTSTFTNYTLTTLYTETNTTTVLTIIENGHTNVLTYGDYGGLKEITTSIINRTLGETTVTTTVTGKIDGAVKVKLDGYVDSSYYSTSTITVDYHYIAVLTTTNTETYEPIENNCYVYIAWVWVFGYNDELLFWFNDWYVVVQF